MANKVPAVLSACRTYRGNFGKEISVILDHPLITGRSTADSSMTGKKVAEVLQNGLRRYVGEHLCR